MPIDESWYLRPPGVGEHHSAGGVIVRPDGERLQIAFVRDGDLPAYVLPKGHVEPGESLEEAARREIEEESGLRDLLLLGPLGVRERLAFDRSSWKITHYFLYLAPPRLPIEIGPEPRQPGLEDHRAGPRDRAAWFPLDALPEMFWPEQRELLESERDGIRAAVARALVRHQFAARAASYARSASHARDRDLRLLVDHLHLHARERVLDVATGTGFTARALACAGAAVVGVDLTAEMLAEARRGPDAGIRWVVGDAGALPFRDGTFDAATVRRAPHHFPDVPAALAEMTRVLRPGGRLGIVDQVPPEDEPALTLMEDLEKLRDPSHVRAFPATRWRTFLRDLGLEVRFADVVERRTTFEEWIALAGADADRRRAIEARLARADPDARRAIGDDGTAPRAFMKRWVVLVGRKPPAAR